MDPNNHNPFNVQQGQIWEDKDPRRVRHIRILEVTDRARVVGVKTGIHHFIQLRRFNRFKCVEAPATLVNA